MIWCAQVARNPEELQRLMKRHKGDAYMLALQAPQQLPPPLALADRLWSRWGASGTGDADCWGVVRFGFWGMVPRLGFLTASMQPLLWYNKHKHHLGAGACAWWPHRVVLVRPWIKV